MNDKPACKFEPQWYVEAASAATEVGHDDDTDRIYPEGGLIAVCAVIACVFAALVLAHFVAGA